MTLILTNMLQMSKEVKRKRRKKKTKARNTKNYNPYCDNFFFLSHNFGNEEAFFSGGVSQTGRQKKVHDLKWLVRIWWWDQRS